MTRAHTTARVIAARERFSKQMALLPKWTRRAVARATRELALAMSTVDVSEADALKDLAGLVDIIMPPAGPTPVYSGAGRLVGYTDASREREPMPPDKEGDEFLLEARGHALAGSRDQ